MENFNFGSKILVSITGESSLDWAEKLDEINKLGLKSVAVFLSRFDKKERDNFYRLLKKSSITNVPFVHLRDDVGKDEIEFFIENYNTQHFNIHEDQFKILDKWPGVLDKIYLEMDYNSQIAKDVKVKKLGGFCVDLAHFKAAIARGSEEAYYVFLNSCLSPEEERSPVVCNHLGGYNPQKMQDKHIITGLSDFSYLTTLPKYVFGKIIVLEVDNSIAEQLEFQKYLVNLLNRYFLK